jgi:hypothetical protein
VLRARPVWVHTENFSTKFERKKVEMRFAYEAHPEARPASAAWLERCQG